jgi:hypothetical protein
LAGHGTAFANILRNQNDQKINISPCNNNFSSAMFACATRKELVIWRNLSAAAKIKHGVFSHVFGRASRR